MRNISTIMSVMFLIPISKSSIERWIAEIGRNLPDEEAMLQKLIAIKKPSECSIDGYYPLGTDNCVMVVKDEFDRILITHEAKSENFEDAKNFLQKLKNLGIEIQAAYSDYSESFIKALKEVFPEARFQADHFHTVKNIWKHLKNSLLEYRRNMKEQGEKENNDNLLNIAKKLWNARWTLLKKQDNLDDEETRIIAELESVEDGFIGEFRSIIRSLVNIFDHSNSELQAEIKLKNLRNNIEGLKNKHLNKILKFFDNHWQEAMQYLRRRGPGKYCRSSNSESGMRLLRRLERKGLLRNKLNNSNINV